MTRDQLTADFVVEIELFEANLEVPVSGGRFLAWPDLVAVEIRTAGAVAYALRRKWSRSDEPSPTAGQYDTIAALCDASLPRSGGFCVSAMEFDVCAMLEDWAMRNPDVQLPCVLEVNDEFLGLLRVDDTMRWVPGGLVSTSGLGVHCPVESRESAAVEWQVSFWWETGAVTSFSHDEALLRFEDLYFLEKRHNDCTEMHFLGRFDCRSEARLAAARISEAPFYREVVEHFGDEEQDCWSGDSEFLDGTPIVFEFFGSDSDE